MSLGFGVLNMADALPGLLLVEKVVGGACVAADQQWSAGLGVD